jgi:hypothetical protein
VRARLGSWSTPSGNTCDIYLFGQGVLRQLEFRWDRFPLASRDQMFYETTILPDAIRRSREFLELVGPTLLVLA